MADNKSWVDGLTRGAAELMQDVSTRLSEAAKRANESEQLQHWVHRANVAAGKLEEKARELEPVARERASQMAVELKSASRSARSWLLEKLEERPPDEAEPGHRPESTPRSSLDPEGSFDPGNHR